MDNSAILSDYEIESLKSQIEEAKRKAEYDKLKRDLQEINATQDSEFNGVMQMPDTEKVLKAKRSGFHFFELLFDRIRGMFSLRPIIGNIIALMIAVVGSADI